MGYEVIFTAFDKNADGKGYDLEKPSTFTKKLGNIIDDVSLEDVASLVMKQMARRDKFITDVEIYEYTKKKISYKETDGGILIKNKKFVLDSNSLKAADVSDTIPGQLELPQSNPIATGGRVEVLDCDPGFISILARKGVVVTQGKKYTILSEATTMMKINDNGATSEMPCLEYTIQDDNGRKIKIPSIHFIPPPKPLFGQELIDREMNNRNGGPKLMYQAHDRQDMPVLRNF